MITSEPPLRSVSGDTEGADAIGSCLDGLGSRSSGFRIYLALEGAGIAITIAIWGSRTVCDTSGTAIQINKRR